MDLLLFEKFEGFGEDTLIATFTGVISSRSGNLPMTSMKIITIHSADPRVNSKTEFAKYMDNHLLSEKFEVHDRSLRTFKLSPQYYWQLHQIL